MAAAPPASVIVLVPGTGPACPLNAMKYENGLVVSREASVTPAVVLPVHVTVTVNEGGGAGVGGGVGTGSIAMAIWSDQAIPVGVALVVAASVNAPAESSAASGIKSGVGALSVIDPLKPAAGGMVSAGFCSST
jgi:hypothetical protein